MAAMLESWERFLFTDFPSRETLTTKDYENDEKGYKFTPADMDEKFKRYQKVCLYGLGSMFWTAASGVLGNLQKDHPSWVHWLSIYFVGSLVLMLNGLSAALFPKSTPMAVGTAGLGAWAAYIYMLATFHIASLQFHSHQLEECIYSMGVSSFFVTLHWGYSSQDPLVFHILSKSCIALVVMVLYLFVQFLLKAKDYILSFLSRLLNLSSSCMGCLANSWKKLGRARNRRDGIPVKKFRGGLGAPILG